MTSVDGEHSNVGDASVAIDTPWVLPSPFKLPDLSVYGVPMNGCVSPRLLVSRTGGKGEAATPVTRVAPSPGALLPSPLCLFAETGESFLFFRFECCVDRFTSRGEHTAKKCLQSRVQVQCTQQADHLLEIPVITNFLLNFDRLPCECRGALLR
jgi:hypothetical protein